MNNSKITIIAGIIASLAAISIVLMFATSQNEIVPVEDKFLIYTTFYPLQQFTQNVSGDAAEVRSLIPANSDPHAFDLGPKTIAALTYADMLVYNGADFEPYIDEIKSIPDFNHIIFVDSSEGIALKEGEIHDHHEEVHEEKLELNHVYDPHIWLDPILAKQQVMTITSHLIQSDPQNAMVYQTNAKSYSDKLDALDQEIREELSVCNKDTFVPFHNAFSYFADRYDLHTLSVIQEFSPSSPITAKDIETLINFVEKNDVKYFFTEENRNPKLAERLATELGGNLILFSPLESLTDQDDPNTTYFDKMKGNIENLKIALECS